MSARIPRRLFSSPFVVTLAAAPACFVQSSTPPSQPISQSNPGQPTQTDPRPTPPPPETQSPTYIANPPRPTNPPADPAPPVEQGPVAEADPPPANEQAWMITKTGGSCTSQPITHCPPKAMCNPPRPQAYSCIEGINYPAKVTKTGTECRVERDPPCPRNAKCKAPPVVPCPR